jgi:hypothetical protein
MINHSSLRHLLQHGGYHVGRQDQETKELARQKSMPVCRACLDLKVPTPRTKGSRTSNQEKDMHPQADKRQRLIASAENKRRKARRVAAA